MDKYNQPLEEGKFYHIYNQGNNRETLFYKDENYIYFMKKFDQYLSNYVELYAFCLMPNHFHLLVRIRALEELSKDAVANVEEFKQKLSKSSRLGKFSTPISPLSEFISEQFRRFFMSYSKSINKQNERRGSLFRKYFKRKQITSLRYLQQAVVYIHRNPVHHGFDIDFRDYRWSSYNRVTDDKITKLKKREVLEWFGDKDNYRYVHNADIEDDIE
jgi:REP element-mobilizing transposase RayT